jgi:hypothetical protein
MGIPIVGNKRSNTGDTQAIDVSITVSSDSNRILVAFAAQFTAATTLGVTSVVFDPGGGNEQNFTEELEHPNSWVNNRVVTAAVWYLINPPAGTYAVRFTWDAAPDASVCAVLQVNGADQTDPIGDNSGNDGGAVISNAPSVQVDTMQAESLVLGCTVPAARSRMNTWRSRMATPSRFN